MGSKGGSPPASPDYASLIPIQEASNTRQFNTMLNASRVNSVTPYGRQSWTRGSSMPPGTPTPNGLLANPAAGGGSTLTGNAPPPQYINAPWESGDQSGTAPQLNPDYAAWQQQNQQQPPPPGQGPGTAPGAYDQWTLTQEFSPEQQALYDQDLRIRGGMGDIGENMLGNVRDTYSQSANFAQDLPDYQYLNGPNWRGPRYRTNMNSRDDAERAIYDRQMRYMSPDYAGREKQLHDRLTAQGFNVNDPGYKSAMDSFQAQRDRAMADVRDQAILGGGQEATAELGRGLSAEQARFGAGMQGAQFMSGQQNQALNYALQQMGASERDRARTLNEMNAFRTGSQVQLPGTPAQFNTPNLQNVDQLGLAQTDYANRLGGYNASQAGANNFMSGLFGLGGAVLGGPMGYGIGQGLGRMMGGG